MAINNPIIAAGPTIRKIDVQTTVAPLIEVEAPGSFFEYKTVDGVLQGVNHEPQWEGQMLFVKLKDFPAVTVYIAISITEGTITALRWREASVGATIIDPRTGKEKDPNYDLYFS
jgi:hypothetical protein